MNGCLVGALTLAAFVIGAMMYSNEHTFEVLKDNFLTSHGEQDTLRHAQTMAFVVLSVSQLFHSLNLRHETKSIFQTGLFTNKYLVGSIILGILLQLTVISVTPLANVFEVYRLSFQDWVVVLGLSIVPVIVNEIVKIFTRAKLRSQAS